MAKPYFPPPAEGGRTVYRQAAERPIGPAPRFVVARPLPPPQPPSIEIAPDSYWGDSRFRAFTRFPRLFGAVLTLCGAWLTWSALHLLQYGGFYTTRIMVGPLALVPGVFVLIAGFPHDARMRPPPWWIQCMIATSAVGLVAGFALLYAIEH